MSRRREQRQSKVAGKVSRGPRNVVWGGLALIVIAALSATVYRWSGGASPFAPKGLNLLLITVDTTRADHLGCYGDEDARTPVIDNLAREGARFTTCSTCSPLTLPSHSSIMTGEYPHIHGARQNGTGRLVGGNVTLAETLSAAGYSTHASVAAYVLNRKFGVAQGFDTYHDVVVAGSDDPLKAERKGDVVCDDACGMLRSSIDKPFFLWVHFFDPHHPYESAQHPDPLSIEAYDDEIAFMDEQIGRLFAVLRDLDLERNTLVVMVGDHGEGLGQHDEPRHGLFLYGTTLHAPLIFRCPEKVAPGQTIAANVRTVDVAPTILEFLEVSGPKPTSGRSLAPLLNGSVTDLGLQAYSESFEARVNYGASQLRSLLDDGWKYILAPKPELYYLPDDPGEIHNLIDDEPERAAALREQLRTLIAQSPPPPAGEDSNVALAEIEVARLRALGYAASEASPADEGSTELDRFEPRGSNPRDILPLMEDVVRARQAMTAGNAAEAERAFRTLIEQMPEATRLQADLAEALGRGGKVDEAVAAYDRAVAAAPEDRYTRRKYARYLMHVGRVQDAVNQYAAMLRGSPDDTTALHEIGIALTRLKRFQEAEEHLQLALRLEPGTPRLIYAMGFLRWNQQRFAEAAQYFRQTLAIDPNFAPARDALAKLEAAASGQPGVRP